MFGTHLSLLQQMMSWLFPSSKVVCFPIISDSQLLTNLHPPILLLPPISEYQQLLRSLSFCSYSFLAQFQCLKSITNYQDKIICINYQIVQIMTFRSADIQRSSAKDGKVYTLSSKQQQIQYTTQIPLKQTPTFHQTFYQIESNTKNSANQNRSKDKTVKYVQQRREVNNININDNSLSKYKDTITQRYNNSNDKIHSIGYTKYSNQDFLNRKKSSQGKQSEDKSLQRKVFVDRSYQRNGSQNIKIIEYQTHSPQSRNIYSRHDQNSNTPINFSRNQVPKINISQGAKLQNSTSQNSQHNKNTKIINYGRNANRDTTVQTHNNSQDNIPSAKTINLNELDLESQCNSSSIGKSSSKQRGGSFRHSHLQSHSNTSQVFKNILLQSHHLSAKTGFNQKKLAISIYLRQIFLRRTRFSFQLIRQFYDFGEQDQSEVSSMDQYTWLMYNDQKFHTLCKIYQTKVLEEKLWAFLNLKYWQLFKNMRTFTIKIQTVTRKIQDRVNKLYKKDSFKTILEYANQIGNKKSETKASQPQTPNNKPKPVQPKPKDKIIIDTSKSTSNSGIYTTYVASTRKLTYEQYQREKQERDRSRRKQQNSSLSRIRQQPETNMGQRKSTITYVSRSNISVLSDENKSNKKIQTEGINSGATYVSNQSRAKLAGKESSAGKIKTVINSQSYASTQNRDDNKRSSYVIPYTESLTERRSIIDDRRIIYTGKETKNIQKESRNVEKESRHTQRVTSNAVNRVTSNTDRYHNESNRNTNIYRSRESIKNDQRSISEQRRNTKVDYNYSHQHRQHTQVSQPSNYGVRQEHHYYYYGVVPDPRQHQRLMHSRSIHLEDSNQGSVNKSYHYYCNHPGHTQVSHSHNEDNRFRQLNSRHVSNQEINQNYLKSANKFNSPIENDSKLNSRSGNRHQHQTLYRSRKDNKQVESNIRSINQKTANRLISVQPVVTRSQKNIYIEKDFNRRSIDKISPVQHILKQQLKLNFQTNQQCTICKDHQDKSSINSSTSKRLQRQRNRMSSRRKELKDSRTDLSDHSINRQKEYCKHGKKIKRANQPQSTKRAYYAQNSYSTTINNSVVPKQSNRYDIQQRIMYMRQLQSKNPRSQTKPFKIT